MTQSIAVLEPIEFVTFDHATLADLCAAEGPGAEAAIAETLTEVETLIAVIATQMGYVEGLGRSCTALARAAGRIGMTTIHDGAQAVLTCIAQGDATARVACTARLVRLGEPRRSAGWAVQVTPDTVA